LKAIRSFLLWLGHIES